MDKIIEIISKNLKNILSIILIIILAFGAHWVYQTFFEDYVFIRFKDLGPLTKSMPAYYKGFVIGTVTDVGPDEDFKASIVKVVLNDYTKLPANTFVVVRKFPNSKSYLEFVYPDKPALKFIERGDILEGITSYSLEKFMKGQAYTNTSDIVSVNVLEALEKMNETSEKMTDFFVVATEILKENRQNIKITLNNTKDLTGNLAQATKNTSKITEKLIETTDQLTETSKNITTISKNIADGTENLDITKRNIDATICEIHATSKNLKEITSGLQELLNKRFAGLRVLFGKPIDKKSNNCK